MDQTTDLKNQIEAPSAPERMLEAAGRLFADRPFDAVSTREIAKAAGVNLSAISYHFESKEGLYKAVFEKIVQDLKPIRVSFGKYLQARMIEVGDDRKELAEVVSRFVSDLVSSVMSPENPRWRMRLIIREIQAPDECFDIVMKGHVNVMHDLIGILVAKALGESERTDNVRLTTHSILTMCLQYALSEALVKERLGWTEIGNKEIQKIQSSLTVMILRILNLAEYSDISVKGQ